MRLEKNAQPYRAAHPSWRARSEQLARRNPSTTPDDWSHFSGHAGKPVDAEEHANPFRAEIGCKREMEPMLSSQPGGRGREIRKLAH
jgi:hypothetical protein